jgi:hypothetical protein
VSAAVPARTVLHVAFGRGLNVWYVQRVAQIEARATQTFTAPIVPVHPWSAWRGQSDACLDK